MTKNLTLVLALIAAPASAVEAPRDALTLTLENDLYASGRDQDYTNGVRVAFTSAKRPFWAVTDAHRLPLVPRDAQITWDTAIGQSIFTPRDITARRPDPRDRPYAGFLHAAFGLTATTPLSPAGAQRIDQWQLTLGIIGPASLAEPAQKFIHQLTGSDRPRGWADQLRNEPALILTYRHARRLPLADWGFARLAMTPHAGFAIGNVHDYANAGVTLTLGDGALTPRIEPPRPGAGLLAADGFRVQLHAGVDARIVARSLFLDGNSFRAGPRVESFPIVADFDVGLTTRWRTFAINTTYILRTREHPAQRRPSGIGAISATLAY